VKDNCYGLAERLQWEQEEERGGYMREGRVGVGAGGREGRLHELILRRKGGAVT
jgi:hypothetical protein